MDMNGVYWLILFVVLIIIEALTVGLTTIWFAIGSLAAYICVWLGAGLPLQVGVFIVVSVLLFILTRPIAMKYFNKDREKTNAESLVGKKAWVKETIDNVHASGKVEVNGLEWTARTADEAITIEKDTKVTILGIEGVKLIVKKEEEEICQ